MSEAAATEVKKSRKPADPNAPKREVGPRPLYIVYTIAEGSNDLTIHLNSRKAEEVLADVSANPERKYARLMVK